MEGRHDEHAVTEEPGPGRELRAVVAALAAPTADEIADLDAWWRANNYLTVGQIYLLANPLLRERLTSDDIKPRACSATGARARACRWSTRTPPA